MGCWNSIGENILRVSNIGQPKRQQRLFCLLFNQRHTSRTRIVFIYAVVDTWWTLTFRLNICWERKKANSIIYESLDFMHR